MPKKKQKKISLSQNDWYQFANLLDSGNTLEQILSILSLDSSNILKELESGMSFEKLVLQNNKGRFYEHLSFFIGITTFSSAIYSAIEMMKLEKELLKKFRKQSIYPCFIFCFSFFSIYLFSQFIIPQLLQNFENETQNQSLFTLINVLRTTSLYLFFAIISLLVVFIVQRRVPAFHYYLYRKLGYRITCLRQYTSYILSGYLIQLHRKGMSSKQALQYMITLQKNTYLSYTVKDLYDALDTGEELHKVLETNPFLDRQFKNHFMIGSFNGDIMQSLTSYMHLQMDKWELQLRRISYTIQAVAYIFVGILVVCVYQIMLIPLQMLEEL